MINKKCLKFIENFFKTLDYVCLVLEGFSIDCRKTKTKEITLADHKGHRESRDPIKTQIIM